jgi:hypothetical protein
MQDPITVVLKNNTESFKGLCPVCTTPVFRFLKRAI